MKDAGMKQKIFKTSLNEYLKHFGSIFSLTLLYALFVLLCLFISYFLTPLIILFVPLVVMPFTFAYHVGVNAIRDNQPFNIGLFFKGFSSYFSSFFRGGYSSIRNMVISVTIFFLLMIGIFLPFETYEMMNNPEMFNYIANLSFTDTEILNIILENKTFNLGMMLAVNIAGIVSTLIYLHLHLRSSVLMSYQLTLEKIKPMIVMKQFAPYQLRLFSKTFYKEYLKMIFIPLFVFLIGYVGGFFLHYFLITKEATSLFVFSLIMGFVFLLPLLGFVLIYMDNIAYLHQNELHVDFAKSVLRKLEGYERISFISEDDKAKLNMMKQEAEEIIKNTKI